MAASRTDTGAYLRGKAYTAGVRVDTPIGDALDVLTVLEIDGVPGEQMDKWRQNMNMAVNARPKTTPAAPGRPPEPDRETWGLLPGQREQTSRLTAGARPPQGTVAAPLK